LLLKFNNTDHTVKETIFIPCAWVITSTTCTPDWQKEIWENCRIPNRNNVSQGQTNE